MKEEYKVKLERIIKECIDRAEFDRKCYLEGYPYEAIYLADKKFNLEHTTRQIEKLFDKGS